MCVYRTIGEVSLPLHWATIILQYQQVLEKSSFVGSPGIPHLTQWVGNSGAETLVVAIPSAPARYVSISLEIVGTVSQREFNMQAHGNWSSALPHGFCNHAGTFLLEGHGSQVVALTWGSVLDNIKHLQGGEVDGIIQPQDCIVFTHRLFRVHVFPWEVASGS